MDECEGGEEGEGMERKGEGVGRRNTPHPRPSTMKAFWESGQLVDPAAGGRTYGGETASLARSSTDLS